MQRGYEQSQTLFLHWDLHINSALSYHKILVFHALSRTQEAVTLRVETPRTKPPQPPDGTGSRPNSAAAEPAAASQPAAAAAAAPTVAVAQMPTDPRRGPSAVAQPPPDPRRPPTVVNQPPQQQPPAQPIIPSDPRRAPKTTVIGTHSTAHQGMCIRAAPMVDMDWFEECIRKGSSGLVCV